MDFFAGDLWECGATVDSVCTVDGCSERVDVDDPFEPPPLTYDDAVPAPPSLSLIHI